MVFHRNKILILWLFQASLTQVVTSCVARSPTNRRSSRQPFYLHQQVPNIDEFSQGASGPPGEPIKYGTSAYKRLNTNYNPGIVFEHVQEKSGDTRRMSKRCMDALNKLEKSVKERWDWGRVKVRVIAAWDEEIYHKHDTHSLHYEGRAVDITTSDRDRSKMGVLARLAVEAGFDWVRYIQKYKVHASCRADGKRDPNLMGMGCFRSNSTVQLEDGTTKEMARLRIGDRVQSVDKEGRIIYSDIVMFLDNKPNKKDVLYFVLKTENPQTELYITKSHLLYVRRRFSNLWEVLFAKVVQKGDYINVFTEGKLLPAKVMDILVIPQQGAIAPLTSEGNIIVDGVLASCYALLDDQEFVNSIFWPAKALYRFFPSLLNASNKPQEGVHWYARLLIFLNNYISVLT